MKLGILLSHHGLAGLWTPGCQGAAILAAAELNLRGGVLGEQIELIHMDSGETPSLAFEAARSLVLQHRVDAIVGLQSSNLRTAVRRGTLGIVPYIYTPQYEGGYCGPGTATLGPTDAEVLGPALRWMAEQRHARRFFFLGNDYVWPRVALGTTAAAVKEARGQLVGQALLPLGQRHYDEVLARIRLARPDVLVMAVLGEDAVTFNRAFSDAGLAPLMLRLSMAFEETQLLGVAATNTDGLFAAQTYFRTLNDHGRAETIANYDMAFGHSRPSVTSQALGCYDGVYLVAALARHVGRTEPVEMVRFLKKSLSRSEAHRLLGRCEEDNRLRLAEADGTSFSVRGTL